LDGTKIINFKITMNIITLVDTGKEIEKDSGSNVRLAVCGGLSIYECKSRNLHIS